MSVSEDSKESMDRLRRIQKSVLQRRGKVQSASSVSEDSVSMETPVSDENPAPKTTRPKTDTFKEDRTKPSRSETSLLDTDIPSRQQEQLSQPQKSRQQYPELNSPNAPHQKVSQQSQPQHGAMSKFQPISPGTHLEVLSNPTGFGDMEKPAFANIANANVARRCKLEKRDGSLPVINGMNRKTLASLASADPVNVLMPALEEFIAPVPFRKVHWFLPRVNHVEPILPASQVHESSAVFENLNDDCVQILSSLNPQQALAVTAETKRACLVLAGPGSGKTRVLTHRAAYICRRYNLAPHRILAVTFTNKAAEEMKNRLKTLLMQGGSDDQVNLYRRSDFVVGTFHSICARILRTYGEAININPDFQICDSSDTRQVVSSLIRQAEGELGNKADKVSGEATIISKQISRLKNHGVDEMKKTLPRPLFAKVNHYRREYDKKLRSMNKLDFDDLLLETRLLLNSSSDSLQELQSRYLHVLVDEWQDTNTVQFDIVAKLAEKNGNIFVVGDDDQSIFKFRGADSRNLTRFTENFPNAQIVTLEKNYRSTGCIVNASQGVIENNRSRPVKTMHTSNAFGEPVVLCEVLDGRTEAEFIVRNVQSMLHSNKISSLSNVAVLYRTNAQSRPIEEACIKASMRYRLVGGTRFYDRQEVKDLMSYVRLLVNPADDIAVLRAINTPNRGIGAKTIEVLEETASRKSIPMLHALEEIVSSSIDSESTDSSLRKNALKRLADFHSIIEKLKAIVPSIDQKPNDQNELQNTAADVIAEIVKVTDFKAYLEKRSKSEDEVGLEKFAERWRNVEELESAAARHSTLHEFLDSVALLALPSDQNDADGNGQLEAITLLTLHSGKGLEFEAVFIAGFEEGVLPMIRSQDPVADAEAVEEERRLAYVGMTRAKKYLTLSRRTKTLQYGQRGAFWRELKPSRFLNDIPNNLVRQVRFSSTSQYRSKLSGLSDVNRNVRPTQWHVGDSVRSAEHGRGTVVNKKVTVDEALVEVIFTSGKREILNPITCSLELLYSPSTAS